MRPEGAALIDASPRGLESQRVPGTLRRHLPVLAVLAFSVFAWWPLLTPAYFFGAHDAPHSVFFLVEFDQTLRDGYLWPRWSPDFAFGYGYPLFNMYAPLAFYAAEMVHLAGFTFVGAVKVMYIVATIGSGLTMYGFLTRIAGRTAGVLGAVVYMLAPFHLLEMYVRCAFPEFVALALFPLVLWAFTDLVERPTARRAAWAGLSYGLLALTHHSSLLTFTPFLVGYVLFLLVASALGARGPLDVRRVGGAALSAVGGALLGLFLAAVYLLPMLLELRYIRVGQWTSFNYDYRQHFVYVAQLLSSTWGYGYSGPGLLDGMSFQMGTALIVLMVFGGWLAIVTLTPQCRPPSLVSTSCEGARHPGEKQRELSRGGRFPHLVVVFFLVTTALCVWLMSPSAEFVWQVLPVASLVQFPWRLLGLAALGASVVAAAVAHVALIPNVQAYLPQMARGSATTEGQELNCGKDSQSSPLLAPETFVLCIVIVLGSFQYTLPRYTEVEEWRESPQAVIRWDQFSPTDRVAMVSYVDQQPMSGPMQAQYMAGEPLQVAAVVSGSGMVETVRHGGASDEVRVLAQTPVTVQFYTYDYPGWRVTLDGLQIPHRHEPPYGLITVDVAPGEHHLTLRMGSTGARLAGGAVSLMTALLVVVLLIGRLPFRRR